MGSGRSIEELTSRAKKPREIRRREKVQRKRLIALGVPEDVVLKLNSKEVRTLLKRPEKTRKLYAAKRAS